MDWNITSKDMENAKYLHDKELIDCGDKKAMFTAGLYCILSAAEKHDKQVRVYNLLLENGLDCPENILSDPTLLESIIKIARFPKDKQRRIRGYSEWWQDSKIDEIILEDIDSGKTKEFDLRKRIAKEAPGLGLKSTSLFMIKCGYENIIPVDIWIIRYLHDNGTDVVLPDFRRNSGPTDKEYLDLEKRFIEISQMKGYAPVLFQYAVWSKYSKWTPDKQEELKF